MKIAHSVEITIFSKEQDDYAKVIESMKGIIPFDIGKEKLALIEENAEGLSGNTIKIARAFIKKEHLVRVTIENILEKLGKEQVKMLQAQIESRIDEEMFFFLRLDREKLIKENRYVLTDSGNCYHVRICIAAFPKTIDSAKQIISALLGRFI
jgi:RNA binding exosome subunit